MRRHEGVYRIVNAVVYCSHTGESKRIAAYLAEQTGYPCIDIFALDTYAFDTAVLVFPVHCQNVPAAVKKLLSKLHVNRLVVVATYGKMSFGNVLHEIQKRWRHTVVAAAYVPTKHAYVSEPAFDGFDRLQPLIAKIRSTESEPIAIPKTFKNPLSNVCKGLRSRLGVKLYRDKTCDRCGACATACRYAAIVNGKTNGRCIRCMQCVASCPRHALHFENRLAMRLYLRKKKTDQLILYV